MSVKPTYEELEQTVEELKREVFERDRLKTESLNVFKKAVEASSDAIGFSTAKGHHYYQNKSFDNLFGDIGSDPPSSVYVDEEVGREVFETIMGGDPWDGEVKMQEKDGSILNILLRAYPIKDDEGKVKRVVGVHTDITERKRAVEELKEACDRSQQYLDVSGVMFVAIDAEQNVTMVNRKGCEILGYEEYEIVGKNWFDYFIKAENIEEIKGVFNQVISGNIEPVEYYENSVLRKDGDYRIMAWHNSIIRDESGCIIGSLSSGEDVTELKQAEESLQKAHDELERKVQKRTEELVRANELLGLEVEERKKAEEELIKSREQLRDLSHYLQSSIELERSRISREVHDDLGQVLTAIKMDVSWLEKKIHKDQRKLVQKAVSTNDLVSQAIRTVKKITSELRPGLLDDLGLVAAIEWQADDFKKRSGIQVEIKIDPSEINLSDDLATTIFRIFQESLTNIARHSQATEVDLVLTKKDSLIKLVVIDNGVGITKEQIADRDSFGILGIKERVHSFGGEIEISSQPGEGTTVSAVIPIK